MIDRARPSHFRRSSICLVIPAFREGRRIEPFLRELVPALTQLQQPTFSLTVVDDGSGPLEVRQLRSVLAPYLTEYPDRVRLLELPKNQGKGGAIIAGWESCSPCDYLAFADADGSIAASEIVRLGVMTSERPDPLISYFASRVRMLGRTVERNPFRHYSGRIFATLVGCLTGVPVYDSQCGCKFVPYSVYQTVRSVLVEKRFAFDVELMLAIIRSSHLIEEIPIDWRNVNGGKVSFIKDSFRMAWACFAICRRSSKWTFKSGAKPPAPTTDTSSSALRP